MRTNSTSSLVPAGTISSATTFAASTSVLATWPLTPDAFESNTPADPPPAHARAHATHHLFGEAQTYSGAYVAALGHGLDCQEAECGDHL